MAKDTASDNPLEVFDILDERSAAFFALGMARATNKPVALLGTSGSAPAHYLPAIIEANHTSTPLVVISADRPSHLQGCGAPQTTEQKNLFGVHVRGVANLQEPATGKQKQDAQSTAAQIAALLNIACQRDPGPVHINAPFDEPLWLKDAADECLEMPATPAFAGITSVVNSEIVANIGRSALAARRGVIVIGPRLSPQAHRESDEFATAVAALSQTLGWPIISEPCSQVRFHPVIDGNSHGEWPKATWIGTAPLIVADCLTNDLRPDFVLRFGQVPTSKVINQWMAREPTAIHVLVSNTREPPDPFHICDTIVGADDVQFCELLLKNLGERRGKSQKAWRQQWRQLEMPARKRIDAACEQYWEGSIARETVRAAALQRENDPPGLGASALHVASSMPIRDLELCAQAVAVRLPVFANRGINGIDGTLSTAVGELVGLCRCGGDDSALTLLIGDLALLHDLSGLLLLRRLGDGAFGPPARLTVVVVDNSGGGIFDNLPISANADVFERAFIGDQGLDLADICRGFGLRCQTTDNLGDLRAALAAEQQQKHTGMVIAKVDRAASLAIRHNLTQTG